jgi:hypothetical protein
MQARVSRLVEVRSGAVFGRRRRAQHRLARSRNRPIALWRGMPSRVFRNGLRRRPWHRSLDQVRPDFVAARRRHAARKVTTRWSGSAGNDDRLRGRCSMPSAL